MKKLLIETFPIRIERTELLESINKNGNRMIIPNMIIQRADVPNKNRRIYSKSILEREANKLMESLKSAGNRGIIGELDHPECQCPTSEILTFDGWKLLKDVSIGETILTLNTNTGECEWEQISRVVNDPYKGKMVSFKGKSIDISVTPNHRFYLIDRKGEYVEKTAQEILDLKSVMKVTHLSIPTVAEKWNGQQYNEWILPPYIHESKNISATFKEIHSKPLILNVKSFFGFLGFYLAEGHVENRKKRPGFKVTISQNKGERADKFLKLLSEMSSELTWNINERKNGRGLIISCSDARLWTYLEPLGNKYTKFIPDEIKNASSDLLQELLDWYLLGDGSETKYKGYSRKSIFSVSKKLMEDFNEVLLKVGITGIIKEQIPKDRFIEGRLIEAKNSKTLYRLWFKQSRGIHIDFRFLNVEEIDYDDTVHCVTVPNGTFYTRNNGLPFWSGNSNVVNLRNACIGIMDIKWKGNDQLGDVEVLNTPSGNILREILLAGYVPGISSRGLGSVESAMYEGDDEVDEVQDDFELLTYDAVSDPSTHNAYFKEIREGHQPKNIQQRPYQKANDLMRDLICELSGVCNIC